jgi:hypothetical protein
MDKDLNKEMIVEKMKKGTLTITNDTELHARIMHLHALGAEQEIAIKRNVQEIVYSMHPSVMIKNAIKKITEPHEMQSDLKNAGIALGGDFLISKLFGKGITLKGFISQFLMKKAMDYVMHNHSDTIKKGLGKLGNFISKKREGSLT